MYKNPVKQSKITGVRVFSGISRIKALVIVIIDKILNRIFTRFGNSGFKNMIIKGNVISSAISVEEIIVTVTTMGMVFINSPIIPLAKSNGTKAQMVVTAVDTSGTIKSLQTRIPVWAGVNLPVA